MQIRERHPEAGLPIESYGDGGFHVNNGNLREEGQERGSSQHHQGSVIIGPTRALPWNASDIADATPADFESLVAAADDIDLLLIGTGEEIAPLPAGLQAYLSDFFGIEQMATGAAARTYNVLLAEGRRIAAALIAVA